MAKDIVREDRYVLPIPTCKTRICSSAESVRSVGTDLKLGGGGLKGGWGLKQAGRVERLSKAREIARGEI